MRIQRVLKQVSLFLAQLGAALFKAVVTSAILGMVVISVMHYMGVPIPSTDDLLRGVSRLANVLS
jgi:hypothetical protein